MLKASIAIDNGRASEFIRKKRYADKTRCYECGEEGHLSYACPKNLLGEREPPKKKERKRRRMPVEPTEQEAENSESDEGEDPALDSLSQAIAFQQAKVDEERHKVGAGGNDTSNSPPQSSRHPRIKKSAYFSDEEELSS